MEPRHDYNQNFSEFSYTFKVDLIGSKASGKTSLRRVIVDHTFEQSLLDLKGNRLTTIKVDNDFNIEVQLDLWDICANDYMYCNFSKKSMHAILLVIDLSNRNSYEYIKDFINNELKQAYDVSVTLMMVGTKQDIKKREVNGVHISNLESLIKEAEVEYLGYIEVSAKNNEYIQDLCQELANGLMYKYLPDDLKPASYVSYFEEKEAKKIIKGIKNEIENPQTSFSFSFNPFIKTVKITTLNGGTKDVPLLIKGHLDSIEIAEVTTSDRRRYYNALKSIEDSCKIELSKMPFLSAQETKQYFQSKNNLTAELKLFGKPNVVNNNNNNSLKEEKVVADNPKIEVTEPFNAFMCPIAMDIMTDPVLVITSGYTYERTAIEAHFNVQKKNGKATDPMVPSALFELKDLVPNRALLDSINEFNEKFPQNSVVMKI